MKKRFYNKKPKSQKAKLIKTIEKVIDTRQEDLYINQDVALTNPVTQLSGVYQLLSYTPEMVQGVNSGNRKGDAVRLKNLDLILRLGGRSASYDGVARVLLIRQKNPNGATLARNEFQTTGTGSGCFRPCMPKSHLDGVEIMYDKFHPIVALGNVTADVNNHVVVRIRKFNMNLIQRFFKGANSGTITDVSQNALFLWVFGSQDSTGTNECVQLLDLQWSLTFEDA